MVPNTTMMTYNDGSVGTAVQVTEVQRSLRSSREKSHEETDASFEHGDPEHHPEDEDAALEIAEEKLMDGDEEIESCDEDGKPVVDTEKLERRMMTVALMKSVVETSSAKVPTDHGSAANENEKDDTGGAAEHANHSYGLRKKRSRHSSGRDSPDEEPSPRRAGAPTRANADAVPIPALSSFASTIPLPTPPTLPNRTIPKLVQVMEGNSRQASTVNQASGPMSDGLHSSQVPNPLMHATPPAGNPDVSCLQSFSPVIPNATMSASLPPVPCPLPASTTNDEHRPDFAPSTFIPVAGTISECATVSKRGRIFSIDIDPEGLEFPDMSIDVATQSVFVGSQPLPPIIGRGRAASLEAAQAHLDSKANVTFKEEEKSECHSTEVSLVSATGRGRAMSFEFFSFGINADEPLPPAPELNVSEVQPIFMRPRGDSIIFDPDSFRDGGIHEEHALQEHARLKSRTASLDLGADEIALMNASGFVPASISVAPAVKIHHPGHPSYASKSPLPTAANYQRSPSTFSHSDRSTTTNLKSSPHHHPMAEVPSHTSFQMELLNKDGRIGIYLPEARKARIAKFHSKRKMRIWRKRIKYDCRKKLADSRPRIKGRFVKRSDMDE